MRIDVFEGGGPLDVQPCEFPWKREVTFRIRRSGAREYREATQNGQPAGYMEAIRAVGRKEQMTLRQLQEMSGEELRAKVEALTVDDVLDLPGAATAEADPEAVARLLVEGVDGPLLFTNAGEPLDWHGSDAEADHAGTYFLEHSPEAFTTWIVTEATRIETEFQKFVEAASGNSPTTSASSEAGERAGGS